MTADRPRVRELALGERVRQLADSWDTEHAEECCTLGCANPTGRHERVRFVPVDPHPASRVILDGSAPCPGTCTCDAGPRVAALRALLGQAGRPASQPR